MLKEKNKNYKNEIKDHILVESYISGNDKAFETLIKKYNAKIESFIYSKTLDIDLTQDIKQEVFIKIINELKKEKTYKDEGKFLPWILKISYNQIMDYYRKQKKMPLFRESEEYKTSIFDYVIRQNSDSKEDTIIEEENKLNLEASIKRLPETQREVVILRYYCELSFKEIADLTNVTINSALGRMRYAIKNLRKNIKK